MAFICSVTNLLRVLSLIVVHICLLLWLMHLAVPSACAEKLSAVQSDSDRALLNLILDTAPSSLSASERIAQISSHFIDVPYKENTLIGGPDVHERLVAHLDGFDCFTFLDVVEALRRSSREEDFFPQLTNVRYKDGNVSYLSRRHFFSDWVSGNAGIVEDVTAQIGHNAALSVLKTLNMRKDGSLWLDGVPVTERTVSYLPSEKINEDMLGLLKSGDYIGIYSDEQGLDVQHTGIIIRQNDKVFLRHASSARLKNAVVDDDLMNYLRDKKGVVVYRVGTRVQ